MEASALNFYLKPISLMLLEGTISQCLLNKKYSQHKNFVILGNAAGWRLTNLEGVLFNEKATKTGTGGAVIRVHFAGRLFQQR
ncbi:hypothetical protein F6P94_05015 [Escherichia coli]|nr:hypothetical protein F6P94_05015 [Escherichia coli]